ncbi:hypothetical protein UFOVP662_60 [uncultured Caudovirales phage]|uniref:Uncharacterized protein n=1 Tax=uncultured Caudovirales phage TaxID=2100421 RepID=A0A6J5N9T0_9CAUD|nr:hypothetical protein UFOVP662_60 [uncultured Caudovirales phage]CAB4181682.1 hypothetical protein UFOVP1067_60 [uncultured Caudovirales phage]
MAYNYIGLVNEVNRRLNEVELTSVNFAAAVGFYATIKDAVNASIRDINHTHYEWPFNHVLAEETLSTGITRYSFPNDANTIDFDTFRIKENTTLGNNTVKLSLVAYEDYLESNVDQEYSTDKLELPKFVFHCPSLEYGVTPAPDKDYEAVYEYYRIPVDLENSTDVPSVPERFRHVIIDGAMYHAYMFRSNEQAANISKGKMEEGIKHMRTMLVNRYSYMRSTAIINRSLSTFGSRVA